MNFNRKQITVSQFNIMDKSEYFITVLGYETTVEINNEKKTLHVYKYPNQTTWNVKQLDKTTPEHIEYTLHDDTRNSIIQAYVKQSV